MARGPLTWRNITTEGGFNAASRFMDQAQASMNQGMQGLGSLAERYQNLQDENQTNRVENNRHALRQELLGIGGPRELQQAQESGTLGEIITSFQQRNGGLGPRFDTQALTQELLDSGRQRETTEYEYDRTLARRAADPLQQEYQRLVAEGLIPEAGQFLDQYQQTFMDAGIYGDSANQLRSRQEGLEDRTHILTQRERDADAHARAEEERASNERLQQTLLGILGGDYSGADDPERARMDDLRQALMNPESGINTGTAITGMGVGTELFRSLEAPTLREREASELEQAIAQTGWDTETAEYERQLSALDNQMGLLSLAVTSPERITPGNLVSTARDTYRLQSDTNWTDTPIASLAVPIPAMIGRGLGMGPDTAGRDLDKRMSQATPLIEEFNLTGLTEAHIVDEAMRLVQEGDAGSDGPRKVDIRKLTPEMLKKAANNLAKQQQELGRLQQERQRLQDQRTERNIQYLRGLPRNSTGQ